MKKIITTILLLPLIATAQLTSNTIDINGTTREYLTYVPVSYDGSTAVPVVFCFHGLGDNMNNFSGIGMNYVADTANFIVVTPQALPDPFSSSTAWNSGAGLFGFAMNANVDDIGFISTLIDTLQANYNVDNKRVYACGFSMGGFMSQRLACELNNKIAAIASVAGTIGNTLNCTPGRAIPVCHFHGTGDSTVAYTGNQYGLDAENMISFWEGNNGCSSGAINTSLPDLFQDGYTIEHTLYSSCDNNVEVELFRVDSAAHTWLGPTNDIFYTTEIWKFFMKHTHYQNVSVEEVSPLNNLEIFPNPTSEFSTLELSVSQNSNATIQIYNSIGILVDYQTLNLVPGVNQNNISTLEYSPGVYLLKVSVGNSSITEKLMIER